jgi:septal ring factor EnvC (AmiA/AmiB activator)
MNNPTPAIRPAMPVADTAANRHAQTLAEIQQMTTDYRSMQLKVASYERDLDAKDNRIELLEAALLESRNGEKVYRRKLIRLAAAMEMMVRLGQDAEKIMRDAREIDEVAAEGEAKSGG